MANITYLLGAGASANALPVINEMTGLLIKFRTHIDAFCNDISNKAGTIEVARKLSEQLSWLIDKTGEHQTIDTFARKLFSKNESHNELKKLKKLLSVYFIYEQLPINSTIRHIDRVAQQKETPDKRYDSLIASIIKNEINNSDLMGNVKIVSWNYDCQFEITYRNFFELDSLVQAHRPLQIIPGKWLGNSKEKNIIDLSKFSLIHLNGVAGYYNILKDEKKTILDKYLSKDYTKEQIIEDLVIFFDALNNPGSYNSYDQETINYLNYAWEYFTSEHDFKSVFADAAVNNAVRIAEQTDVLVIIGYSFPIFNRQIDKKVIEAMTKLRKVYIQDIHPENIFTTIKNAFSIFQGSSFDDTTIEGKQRFVLSNNLNQFVLPYEL